jgi:uncharacterized protein (TIGR00369 family)
VSASPTPPAGGATLEAVRGYWQALPLCRELDIRVEGVEPGFARLAVHRNNRSVGGIRNSINGGVLATLAEIAAHVCLGTVLEPGSSIERTQDVSISYASSATAERTVAEARALRVGRTAVTSVTITDGDDGHVNCAARVSCVLARPAQDALPDGGS